MNFCKRSNATKSRQGMAGAANQVLKLTIGHRAPKSPTNIRSIGRRFSPWTAIAKSQDEKIRRFREQQLQQGYKKNQRASPLDARSGALTGRLASRYSATGQTNRRMEPEPIRRRTQRAV
jgi:hypothetical protein